jgi:hypothetical protein
MQRVMIVIGKMNVIFLEKNGIVIDSITVKTVGVPAYIDCLIHLTLISIGTFLKTCELPIILVRLDVVTGSIVNI